jgi:hypothetical protein
MSIFAGPNGLPPPRSSMPPGGPLPPGFGPPLEPVSPVQTGGALLSQRREARGPVSPYGTRAQQPPNACCEGTAQDRLTDWSYVGEGRGAYEMVKSFNYVGEGCGTYNQREVSYQPSTGNRSLCVCLLVAAAVFSVIYLTLSVLARHELFGASGSSYSASGYSFDCKSGRWNWRIGWSQAKKAYCCEHAGTGCERVRPTQPPVSPTTKAPVTTHKPVPTQKPVIRPPLTTKAPSQGCDTTCHLDGKDWTCKDRMMWAASNEYLRQPGACQQAYHMVVGKCPACNACPLPSLLSASMCKQTPTPRPSGGCKAMCSLHGESYSCAARINHVASTKYVALANKCSRAYGEVLAECSICSACSLSDAGCQVPDAATNAGPTASLPYDCNAGFANWRAGWSDMKKRWCCMHANKGCQQ